MSRWKEEFEAEASSENQPSVPRAISAISAIRSDDTPETRPNGANGANGSRHGLAERIPRPDHQDIPKGEDHDRRVGSVPPEWDTETLRLIDWFRTTTPPAEPFDLCRGVTVLDPVRWWRSIEGDIAAGPSGPRACYGAVQGDLRKLYDRAGQIEAARR